MASLLIKEPYQFISRGIAYDDTKYIKDDNYIINPTAEQIAEFMPVPIPPTESELARGELQTIDMEMVDNLLDFISNGTPITQKSKDEISRRKILRSKL